HALYSGTPECHRARAARTRAHTDSRCGDRSGIPVGRASKDRPIPFYTCAAPHAGRNANWRVHAEPSCRARVQRATDRARHHLRRPGGDRDRERAAVRRGAGAHAQLSESLEQQTATSEVLGVISSSPGELDRVFQAMLENATRICEAKFGNLLLYEGDAFRVAAMHGAPQAWDELRRREPVIRLTPQESPWPRCCNQTVATHCRFQNGGRLPRR